MHMPKIISDAPAQVNRIAYSGTALPPLRRAQSPTPRRGFSRIDAALSRTRDKHQSPRSSRNARDKRNRPRPLANAADVSLRTADRLGLKNRLNVGSMNIPALRAGSKTIFPSSRPIRQSTLEYARKNKKRFPIGFKYRIMTARKIGSKTIIPSSRLMLK